MNYASQLTFLSAGVSTLGLAFSLASCGAGDAENAVHPAGGSQDASTDTLFDAARADAAGPCPDFSFTPPHALRFRAYDVRYGGTGGIPSTTSPFGGALIRTALVLPVTPSSDAGASEATFVGLMELTGMPPELPSTDERVRRRVNGEPLSRLDRPGIPNWDEAFAGGQNVGFAYAVEGRIDRAACLLRLKLTGAVRQNGELATNQPLIAMPYYGPGPLDTAARDFSNESAAVYIGALSFGIDLRRAPKAGQDGEGAVVVICDNNCPTIPGSGVRRLEAVLLGRSPVSVTTDAGVEAGVDAGSDTGFDGGSDAGIIGEAGKD